jgi:hypothetical protein
LKFEKTDVPLRLVKWIAGKFDTRTSDIQLPNNFIPVTKETIHNILELPIGGLEVVPDKAAGKSFMLSHFNVTSIPQVSFFGDKLMFGEDLSDEDIFICLCLLLSKVSSAQTLVYSQSLSTCACSDILAS